MGIRTNNNHLIIKAEYLTSAAKASQFPADEGFEVAFAGRSNAGKSSALNALARQKALARTSKTPGRTQMVNFFSLDESHRLVDLPGYGYAKVSANIKARWQKTLSIYLETRQSLKGLILLSDCRHPLQSLDLNLLEWCRVADLPVHVLLTKSDKLSKGQAKITLLEVEKSLAAGEGGRNSVQLFSATKKTGVDQARDQLANWLEL